MKITMTRKELNAAFNNSPIKPWKPGDGPYSVHTGTEAVAKLVAQRCNVELEVTDEGTNE